jgi:hypothetical protein
MISSEEYDDSVSTKLNIGSGENEVSATYKIYTKADDGDVTLSY